MFRTVLLCIIRSFTLYTLQLYMSYRYADNSMEHNYDCEANSCSSGQRFILFEGYMFRTVLLCIIGSFSLYTLQLYVSYRYADNSMEHNYDCEANSCSPGQRFILFEGN